MAQLNYLTRRAGAVRDLHAGELRAARAARAAARSPRTIPEARRLLPHARRSSTRPTSSSTSAPSLFFDEGLDRAARPRLLLRPGRDQADEPRPGDAAHAAARLEAARPLQLPHDRGGPREHDRRHPHRARDRGAAGARRPSSASRSACPHRTPTTTSWRGCAAPAQPVYHPTSTCAIGAVVDPELRVYGVEGLRVVDASVMPTITRAQHQRADDHDRREGGGPDPSTHAARGGNPERST